MTLVDSPPLLGHELQFGAALSGAKVGDEAAFAALWRAHNPLLLRFLYGLADEDDARDVASAVWLEVVRKLEGFEGDAAGFRAWIFTIARSRLIDLRRSRGRRVTSVEFDVRSSDIAVDLDDPAALVGTDASTREAIALISQLPEKQAEVVLLRVVADLDVETVAAILGKSTGVVRVLSHRGLKRLAEILSASGVTR